MAGLEAAYRVVVQALAAGPHYTLNDLSALRAWREAAGVSDEQHTRVRRVNQSGGLDCAQPAARCFVTECLFCVCLRRKVFAALNITEARLRESAENACVVCLDADAANLALVPCGERPRAQHRHRRS